MALRRDREPSTLAWVAAKCLLGAAILCCALSAVLAFSSLRNPGVQDCGNAFSYVVFGKRDIDVDASRLDQGEALRLAQQPTCRERAVPRMQQSLIAFGAFVALGIGGALVGLIDDRIAYAQAPRFETLLAARPVDAPGLLRPPPQLKREDIGRSLPPIEVWDVGWLAFFGAGGLVALVWYAVPDSVRLVLGQVDWKGIVGAAALVLASFLVAAIQLIGSSRRRVPPVEAVEVSVASSFIGPMQPSLGPLGLDAHYLTRLGRNRVHALADVRSRQLLGLVAWGLAVAVAVTQAGLGGLDAPSMPAWWYVPLGWCGLLVAVGIYRAPDRYARLVARPGWRAVRDLRGLATDPLRLGVSVVGALAMPLVEIATFAVVAVAVHDGVEFGRLAAVWVGVRTLTVVSPVNRGVGFIEPLAVLGLVAVGVPLPYAVVTVLLHRILVLWLPLVPGARAYRRLRTAKRL